MGDALGHLLVVISDGVETFLESLLSFDFLLYFEPFLITLLEGLDKELIIEKVTLGFVKEF